MLDTAVRAHRKHLLSIQSVVSKAGPCDPEKAQPPPPPSPTSPQAALEQGDYHESNWEAFHSYTAYTNNIQTSHYIKCCWDLYKCNTSDFLLLHRSCCCYKGAIFCDITGNIQTVPIGYISSCFSVKNGTPRQPTVCGPSRAELCIEQSVFNNPGHALVGLEQYSHVW